MNWNEMVTTFKLTQKIDEKSKVVFNTSNKVTNRIGSQAMYN